MPWDVPAQPVPPAAATPFSPKATTSTVLPPRQVVSSPGQPPVPEPTASPTPSPFDRIAALAGQTETPPPPPAPSEPAVNPATPAFSDFGQSFGLPAAPPPTAAPAPATPLPKPFGDGVSFGSTPTSMGEPTPPPMESTAQASPLSSPAPDQGEAAPGDCVKLGLASMLRGCAAQDIGISPDHIPSWVQTSIPLTLIRPQLGSGIVKLRLGDILGGLDPEMRRLISPTRPDIEVGLPANEIFHALPLPDEGAAPSEPEPEPSPAPAPAAATTPASLPTGVPWPFETKASETPAPKPFEPAPFAPAPPAFAPAPVNSPYAGFAAAPPAPAPAPAPVPAAPPPPSPLTPALEAVRPPFAGFGTPAPLPPTPPASEPEMAPTPAPLPAANLVPKSPGLARVPRDSDKHRQMLLRVLLGSQEDDFDAEGVIRLTINQPGVAGAVCFLDGKPVASAGNGSTEAGNFLRQAQRMLDHVLPLVALTGIEDTETVSVKSDRHVVTFSLQGPVTLAVLHDPLQVEATLREKVTLIARELTGLLQAA